MKKAIIAGTIGLIIIAIIIAFGQIFTVRYVDVRFLNSVFTTDKGEILQIADINTHTNIFVLDEDAIERSVESAFADKSIDVKRIVREFPNRVVIEVSERIALFKMQAETEEGAVYVTPDRNFQRTNTYAQEDVEGKSLIEVTGVIIKGNYNISECYVLRNLANALIACGIREEALPQAIRSIEFIDGKISMTMRTNDTRFVMDADQQTVPSAVNRLFTQYVETPQAERDGKVFVA